MASFDPIQSSSGRVNDSRNTPRAKLIPILLGGIAGVLLALAIIYAIRGRQTHVAEQKPPAVAESPPTLVPTQPDPPGVERSGLAGHAPTQDSDEEREETVVWPDGPPASEPAESDASPDVGDTPPGSAEASDPQPQNEEIAESGQDGAATPPEAEPLQAPAETPTRPKRLPVPGEASQRQAEQRVRDLLKSEFDAADTPQEKLALATRLVELGRETTGDATTRFVLFRLAYQLNVAMGDWASALSVVDTMGEHYEADVPVIKAEVLGQVAEGLPVTPQTADAVKEVLDAVSDGLDASVAADNYAAANRFLKTVRVLARKVGNPAMTRELGIRERELGRMERAFERVKSSLDSVAGGSADAAANLEAGRWFCFEKDNWEQGLPLLAKGSDAALAELARSDLANPQDAGQQIQLAERWLQAAKNEPRLSAAQIVARARLWCDRAMPKLDEAVANDDYDKAARLVSVAISVAREADDRQWGAELAARQKELERAKRGFASVQRSLDALAADPGDPEANLAAGQWYCFERRQWEKGLPLLAKGRDADLAALAHQEIAGADNPAEQLKLADAWWEHAETDRSPMKPAIQSRAAYWYGQALPKLSGLEKVTAEKRLETASRAERPSAGAVGGAIIEGDVALASQGAVVSGDMSRPERITDGEVAGGQAYAKWPCTFTIVFPKRYLIREIRLHLLNTEGWYFRYALATSPDGEYFVPLAESGQAESRGCQTIQFSPRPVKAVRVLGLYCSRTVNFYVCELEAYCVPPGPPPEIGDVIKR